MLSKLGAGEPLKQTKTGKNCIPPKGLDISKNDALKELDKPVKGFTPPGFSKADIAICTTKDEHVALDATAYTFGKEVVFGGTSQAKLLSYEAAHVVQTRGNPIQP